MGGEVSEGLSMAMDWVTAMPAIMVGCASTVGICGGLLMYLKWIEPKEKPRREPGSEV